MTARWVFRPDATYARCRIPALAVTPDGVLHAWCEARREHGGDWGPTDLAYRYSEDGVTWSNVSTVTVPDAPDNSVATRPGTVVHNACPVIDRHGRLHLVYAVNYQSILCDGRPVLSPPEGVRVMAPGPGQGVCLPSGRLVVPVWLSPGTEGREHHHPSVSRTMVSDDDGDTWALGDVVSDAHNPSEGSVTLDGNGVLMGLRSEDPAGLRWLTRSKDGARNWTRPKTSPGLPEVVCQGSVLAVGDALVATGLARTNPRCDLVARWSWDGGRTWPAASFVHVGPARYSALSLAPDGSVWCLYEAGSVSRGGVAIRRLAVPDGPEEVTS